MFQINEPIYVSPYKEPKVWGLNGIGEYWYGAEFGDRSSKASIKKEKVSLGHLVSQYPEEVLGKKVVLKYGKFLPLIKILTPAKRLSVQFHDAKNELWVVTGIEKKIAGRKPSIIIGFSNDSVRRYGKKVSLKYGEALKAFGAKLNRLILEMEDAGYTGTMNAERDVIAAARQVKKESIRIKLGEVLKAEKKVNGFYHREKVGSGDVIPVPQGTLHALSAGVEVLEPQIAGPTQSLEDGATYPVRYFFPDYPVRGAEKRLDLDRVDEINPRVWKKETPALLWDSDGIRVERLPGGFEKKGMQVNRISLKKGAVCNYRSIASYKYLTLLSGEAETITLGGSFKIPVLKPGGQLLLVPACVRNFEIKAAADSEIIVTFTPVS
ncbi:MAG: hypothetical protein HQL28_05555 [Candidatus Omnitrophica bacterium]|nr:hypothetical protein [Candidatus Omnitrophota bacterium]